MYTRLVIVQRAADHPFALNFHLAISSKSVEAFNYLCNLGRDEPSTTAELRNTTIFGRELTI